MMRILFLALSVLIAQTTVECIPIAPEEVAARQLRDGANSFAIRLLKELSSKEQGNMVVSPWSLTTALLMLNEGARGSSRTELEKSLSLSNDIQATRLGYTKVLSDILNNNSTNVLDIANALFPDDDFQPLQEYVNVITRTYNGTVQVVNYEKRNQAASTINHWGEENTKGLIKEVVSSDSLSPNTALVLTNAVYFKGQWSHPFNSNLTTEENFYPNGYQGEPVKVKMMKQERKLKYADIPEMECQALMLPYNNDKFYMLVLLPYENSTVQNVVSKFTTIDNILKNMHERNVRVSLPRFKIESKWDLVEPLQELGVRNVFTGAADLSGISGRPNLKVSDVIQKAVIDVNEEGTEAAAITVANVVLKVSLIRNQSLKFDRPFVTYIAEKESDLILFASTFVVPKY